MKNKRFVANKKNGGVIPAITDVRALYVKTECGECIECLQRKANDWKVRMYEECKVRPNGRFVTLTFSNESIKELCEKKATKYWDGLGHLTGYDVDNGIASRAVYLWLERCRKKLKRQPRHWLVTELGHEGTENIHLHGIVWDDDYETVRGEWKYGIIWDGYENKESYVNEATVNYIIGYVNKRDELHKHYKPKVYASKGIGAAYIEGVNKFKHSYRGNRTQDWYTTKEGYKIAMPKYYRRKLYSDEEREDLWMTRLNEGKNYIRGEKVLNNEHELKLLEKHRKLNKFMGYGGDEKNEEEYEYEKMKREYMIRARIEESMKNENSSKIHRELIEEEEFKEMYLRR
ncbi:MAG: replication initiation protein [Malazfec virus 2]